MDAHNTPSKISVAAVRLADEGIPVRAIARSINLPSEDVYEILRDAIAEGRILDMPRDDWPPGTNRANRSLVNGTGLEAEGALAIACARFFKASPLEAAMLATLLRRNEATKDQLHHVAERNRPAPEGKAPTDPKIVDVMICKIRKKLLPHGFAIETLWGHGYTMAVADRESVMKLLVKENAHG